MTFASGQLIAARYKVIRFIGYGGMGEVYEVEDLKLHERVALKTVRPEIAADSRMIERFIREIQLARKVTHPNVCRVFDIGHDESGRTGEGVSFLTMELLAGETLANRLRVVSRMTASEAFPMIMQMAAGLEAAHRAGIVHRDFKPGNVMLVPSRENAADIRVVVTDFGLARRVYSSESFVASISAPGEVVGTPAYMAPEQVEGKDVTSAADIYAFGCVMFEMLTGTWPFKGDSPFSTAVKRIKEPPPSPRALVPEIDPKWEATILRCLALDPAERFASAEDVLKALRGEIVALRKLRLSIVARWLAASVLLALVALAIGRHIYEDRQITISAPTAPPAAPVKLRRSVAVLGFRNLSGNPRAAWLSTTLSEMLTNELALGEKLRTIPGENVTQTRLNLSLGDTDNFSKETLRRVQANLGSDYVVLGSFLPLGKEAEGRIRLDVRLQDAAIGETLTAVALTGTEAKLDELVSSVGATLREKLGAKGPGDTGSGRARATLPANPEAARFYSEGLAKLRLFDAVSAKDLLLQATAREPQHPMPHVALASAWSALGYDGKAREEAKKAFDRSSALTIEEKLLIEGGYHAAIREWEKAVEIYRKLYLLYPDNLDYGLRLSGAQTSAGKAKAALTVVEAMRRLPAPLGQDPRVDLAEAHIRSSLSDFAQQQRVAEQAVNKGEQLGARLLVAKAKSSLGLALWSQGQPQKAKAAFEDAKRLFASVNDLGGVADNLNNIANLLADEGDLGGARVMYDAALEVYRQNGDRAGVAQVLNNTALLLSEQGELSKAKAEYQEALAIYREIGDQINAATVLDNTANVLWQQGDTTRAQEMYEEALTVRREISNMAGVYTSLNNLGNLLYKQGDLVEARKRFEEGLSVASQVGDQSGVGYAVYNLGEVFRASGDLASSRQQHERALGIRSQLGQLGTVAESQLALAEVALEEDKTPVSRDLARKAAGQFEEQKAVDNQALALAILARAFLAQGDLTEAQKAVQTASAISARTENAGVRITVKIAAARVQAARGKPREAEKGLRAVVAEATKARLVLDQYEARLALGELEMKSPDPSRGRARLLALQKDAQAKGLGLISRKAAAATK